MKVLDLFSGIGGFSLGLERVGMTTVAFCEIEPFPRAVLAKHWPGVPIYDDVRTLTAARLAADGIVPDVICGGFPCQDISVAGKGAGLDGERSGLWHEYRRLIGEVRPRFVIIENVAALRNRGLDTVLGGLSALGYDAEWHVVSAAAIGAPHIRERVWVLGYPARDGGGRARFGIEHDGARSRGAIEQRTDGGEDVAYPASGGRREHGHERGQVGDAGTGQSADCGSPLANGSGAGLSSPERPERREPLISSADIRRAASERRWGRVEPDMDGKIDGLPARLDRTRPVEAWEGNTPRTVGKGSPNRRPRLIGLGNSVVPQIPELIGRAIMGAAF